MQLKFTLNFLTAFIFLCNCLACPMANAADLSLPVPGTMVNLSPAYEPIMIKGLKIHPEDPFQFDFIVDTGNDISVLTDRTKLNQESSQLIKYFLASLTIPEKDLWVNLSPYEKTRMIASNLGQTEMGRDMLAQDYILKQLTASLIYPEKNLGKLFWDRVYAKAQEMYGTTMVPINTFNKVWIVADRADILEKNNSAYITGAHLKVMLEEDYLAKEKHQQTKTVNLSNEIVREIILPEIEKEVNTGKNFAPLRQMFYAMVLASWYKMTLKNTLLNQIYANQSKVKVGINQPDPRMNNKIFERYLQAYKKGVFNYIKIDPSSDQSQPMPRKYFSGGLEIFPNGDFASIVHIKHSGTDHAMGTLLMERIKFLLRKNAVNNDNIDPVTTWIETKLTTKLKNQVGYIDFNALADLYNAGFFNEDEMGFQRPEQRLGKIAVVITLKPGQYQWLNLTEQRFIQALRKITAPLANEFVQEHLDPKDFANYELQNIIVQALPPNGNRLRQARALETAEKLGCPHLEDTTETLLNLWRPKVDINDAKAALIAAGVVNRSPHLQKILKLKELADRILEAGLQSSDFQIFETALTEKLLSNPSDLPEIATSKLTFDVFRPSFKLTALFLKSPQLFKNFPEEMQIRLKNKFIIDTHISQLIQTRDPDFLYELEQKILLEKRIHPEEKQLIDTLAQRGEPLAAYIKLILPSSIKLPHKSFGATLKKMVVSAINIYPSRVERLSTANKAMRGGIDLNRANMQIHITQATGNNSIYINQNFIQEIKSQSLMGIVFKIESILPVKIT